MIDASDEQVLRFVEGELEPGDAAALEQQAARDPGLRARIDALVTLRATLATDADLDGTDVLPAVRAALRAHAPARPRLRLIAWSAPPAVLLAAALAFVVVQRQSDEEEFHAKGAGGPASTTGVAVFRQTDQGLAPVSGSIGADAALAFSYTNSGSEPFSHLMVFAVDDDRRVYWYWPAYGDEGADPSTLTAVTATPGRDVELGEVVRHTLAPGPLTIYAVFLRRAATVAEVEGAIGRGASAPFDLGDDVTVQAVPLVVTP
ncbi:MAG: hypothetical protein A2138_12120 [Deltaproteobacteria bacterium RBG_16_71_12]|nr:MAG: hypothetical protein A2138_12120 [Deltaproteobacteria bacterium RBG_16_71_12]